MDDAARLSSRRIYTGRVLNLDIDHVKFPDGSSGELEIIRHPGASAVVPLLDGPDADDPRVLLIRQYRYAAGGFVYEIPAGRLDSGETPIDCAVRELEEEAGYRASHLKLLVTILTTPGFTDERIHLFLAWGLTRGQEQREPDEFMTVHEVPLSRVMEMLRHGEIPDAKSAIALFFTNLYRRDWQAENR